MVISGLNNKDVD